MTHERMSRRFEEGAGRVREAYGRAHEVVEDHPAYSALACFGVGVAVGAALTLLLPSEKRRKSWYEDYLPDKGSTEEMAGQVRKAVSHLLPDAIARYLKDR